MKPMMMKKVAATSLALAIMLGSGTAAFAKDRDDNKWDKFPPGKAYGHTKGEIQIKLSFDDLKSADVSWAMRYIASLASKQVFEGYEDGTFKPYNKVTRIEAITAAVRLMGLRDQAESAAEMQTQLNFKDAKDVPAWAVGYVAVAAEHNLFAESDTAVQPNKPADRLWATTLLVKALNLDSEAQAKMNTKLTFKDADKIPAGSVGYIAVAVERGLVNGFEDNTFRPNEPVTRAQIAALLDRTGNQLPDSNNDAATGTVSAAVYNNTLTLTNNGQTLTYTLNPNTFVFRGGAQVTPSALQVGDEVRVRTVNGVVVYVEVLQRTDNQQTFTADGTLSYYNVNNNGSISQIVIQQTVNGTTTTNTYNVSDDVKIVGNAQLLTNGHAVQLQGKDNLVTTIVVQ
ncbi:S-layer protein [Gordoniibacillus kamchatkensis]|uniref:S-layer protein n=1 Tax=Gordoniibacillus kamchatkensis TaxID=1590651 RepID=A0ABR5ACG3_9BACL|nr:S-layer homology domain-containing protein [Paenibacillus sp. VKM B-2647]KIL38745.1 S-layer protein [Paenibacillus sp. VKM B-2647]